LIIYQIDKENIMKTRIFTTIALVCSFLVCLAAISGFAGKWVGSIKAPDGSDHPVTYVFNVDGDGDKITGTMQAQGEPTPIDHIKLNGTDISFDIMDDNGLTVPQSGKYYADGDSIAMTINYQGMKLHASLKRADK
jgi:hypothetical protein